MLHPHPPLSYNQVGKRSGKHTQQIGFQLHCTLKLNERKMHADNSPGCSDATDFSLRSCGLLDVFVDCLVQMDCGAFVHVLKSGLW